MEKEMAGLIGLKPFDKPVVRCRSVDRDINQPAAEICDDSLLKAEEEHVEKILTAPYDYIITAPGKMIRQRLSEAFNLWLNIPEEKIEIIDDIVKKLHNASLLIDDIQDGSFCRRGKPVAHSIYGVATTLNSANYVYFLGLEQILKLNHPEAVKIYSEQMLELHKGQGMDIYYRDTYTCPTEKEYQQMVIRKTGGLFGLGIRLMQLFSDKKMDLKPLVDNLGLYFQIRDDFTNLRHDSNAVNKTVGDDITEGKYSYPMIIAIKYLGDSELENILRIRTTDENVKKYCLDKLEKIGAISRTIVIMERLEQSIKEQISEFGENHYLLKLINILSATYANQPKNTC